MAVEKLNSSKNAICLLRRVGIRGSAVCTTAVLAEQLNINIPTGTIAQEIENQMEGWLSSV